ncbi:MAG: type II secretion system secretin GspD [Bdellovibrionota bacterium]
MIQKNLLGRRVLYALLAGLILPAHLMAQTFNAEDEFDEPVMTPPPIDAGSAGALPPPASTRGSRPGAIRSGAPLTTSGGSRNNINGGNTTSQVMSKKQQQKFNLASAEEITNENFPETIESFDFPNAEITDLIKAMSELTGRNFIIDPGVRGKITIIAPSKITVAEAYRAFLSALAVNGYTIVPSGSFLKVKQSRQAQRDSIEIYSGSYYPNTDQMITRIIHLKHISAAQVQREIMSLFSSRDGEYRIYEQTNSIIMSDYGSNVDRVMKILNQLDVPGFEEQLEVIPVRFAKSKDLADLVDKIVNKGQGGAAGGNRFGGGGGSFSAGVPRFPGRSTGAGASSQQGASYFMALPDDRTNSIIVVGNKSGIARVKKLISQLDFRIKPEDSGGVNVYYVKHGDATAIATVLSGIAKEAAPKAQPGAPTGFGGQPFGFAGAAQSSGDIFGGDVKITADKNTNSLVILASKQDYDVVLNLLGKLDTPRDQVYVEAVIMEMSINDTDQWGTGYYQYSSSGYGKGGFNTGVDIASVLSPLPGAAGSPAVLPFTSGTVTAKDALTEKTFQVPSVAAFISLLKKNRRTNILSTPQIMAMDNQEAEIEVGDNVAIGLTTSAATATSPSAQSVQFDKATIRINIKPFISPASETIRMDYKQTIKQVTNNVSAPKALSDISQPLSERNLKTMITVENGDTAVLGGLMKDVELESVNKVPFLGDIPIIGWLFKGRELQKEKVNMLVFLTPKIVRNKKDQRKVLGNKLDERLAFVKGGGGKDPYGYKINDIQKNTALKNAPEPTEVKSQE